MALRVRTDQHTKRTAVIMGGGLAASLFIGRAIVFGQMEIAFLLVLGVIGISILFDITLFGWCSLLLIASVAARGPVAILGLPQILNFLHYPIAIAFAVAAATRPRVDLEGSRAAPTRWLLGLLFLVLLSMVANFSHPLRAAVFLLIVGEPLLVLWAVRRWGVDRVTERKVGLAVLALAAVQVPIGLYQGFTYGFSDPVQGTLYTHGAGHHVLGALFALCLFLAVAAMLARKVPIMPGLALATGALGMMLAPQAMAVTVTAGAALVAMPLVANPRAALGRRRASGARVIGGLLAAVVAVGAFFLAAELVPNIYERIAGLAKIDELPEVQIASERAATSPSRLMFGSGPGTSASRASILLAGGGEFEEGSPLGALNLPPTELGIELRNRTRNVFGGSAEDFKSSTLAFLGDLGVVGFVALIIFLVSLWKEIGRATGWLVFAARTALLHVAMIMFIDNWFEYPEYAVPLALLIGFAISRPTAADRVTEEDQVPVARLSEV